MPRLSTRLGALVASAASSAAFLGVAVVPLASLVAHDAKAPPIADAAPVSAMPGAQDNGTYEIEIQGMSKALVISCQPEASRPQWTVPVQQQDIGGEAGTTGDAQVPNPDLTAPQFKGFGAELVAFHGTKVVGRSGCLNPDQNSSAYTWDGLLTPIASAWGDTPGTYGQAKDEKKRSAAANAKHGMAILPGESSTKSPQQATNNVTEAAPPAATPAPEPSKKDAGTDLTVVCSQRVSDDDDISESDKDAAIDRCVADGGEVSQPAWAGPGFGTWLLAGLAALLTLFAGRHTRDRAEIDPHALGWRGRKAVASSTSHTIIMTTLAAVLGWWAVSNAVDSAGWCFRTIFAVVLGTFVGRAGARFFEARVGEHAKLADAKQALANAPKWPLAGVLAGVLTWAAEGFQDFALLAYGSIAGLMIGAGYAVTQAMREWNASRAQVAHGLAAWLGYASPDALMNDVNFEAEPDRIYLVPPPKVRADLPAYTGDRLAQAMPDWQVEFADTEAIILVPVDADEAQRRASVAASGGMSEGASSLGNVRHGGYTEDLPPLPQPDGRDEPSASAEWNW